jgi:hypothetical protein
MSRSYQLSGPIANLIEGRSQEAESENLETSAEPAVETVKKTFNHARLSA